MLTVSCAELGASCQWEASAETSAELKKKIWEHTKNEHTEMIAEMSEVDEAAMDAQIDAMIEMQGG